MASPEAKRSGSGPTTTATDSIAGAFGPGLGWVDPPKGLVLEQVHFLARHGERTPVRTRLRHLFPERWNLCHAGRKFGAAVLDLTPDAPDSSRAEAKFGKLGSELSGAAGTMRVERVVEGVDEKEAPRAGDNGECLLGELTDLGRISTLRLGKELRKLYVVRLGLLPSRLEQKDRGMIYFRSTNMSRTIESLQQEIRGLLPQTAEHDPSGIVPQILIRNGTNENLLPNTFGCSRLRALDRAFADAAARALNPKLEEIDHKIVPHTDGIPPRVDGHPRLNGILDTVRAAEAHGLPVPAPLLEDSSIKLMESAIVSEWFSGYQAEDPNRRGEFRRLAMGRLLEDLNGRMQNKARLGDKDPLKFALYSTHDTALAGLLSTLDCFDNRWPTFTATVGIELFKDTFSSPSIFSKAQSAVDSMLGKQQSAPGHYVRLRYGNRTLQLPGCAPKGKHLAGSPEFCTLDAFRDIVNSLRHPQGLSWERECEIGRGEKSSK
ncbi:phosphoglycerate mutase-like protein [Violaceomyces palustris]|uniref:Phosphoglycerate mutase-like protein n=1 Tax=Violaceomyces palustris TaxID=1673888 RepID=A0ACD0NUQ5_9BASI|nr:phosphoglycerate mutase-like protein [Violaceomyces palustris]